MKHLRFCDIGYYDAGGTEHPADEMDSLNISYKHYTRHIIADQWWFWGCENIPEVLPKFLTELNISDPAKYIGFCLIEYDVAKINGE